MAIVKKKRPIWLISHVAQDMEAGYVESRKQQGRNKRDAQVLAHATDGLGQDEDTIINEKDTFKGARDCRARHNDDTWVYARVDLELDAEGCWAQKETHTCNNSDELGWPWAKLALWYSQKQEKELNF